MLIQIKQSSPLESIQRSILIVSRLLDAATADPEAIPDTHWQRVSFPDGGMIDLYIDDQQAEVIHHVGDPEAPIFRITDQTIALDRVDRDHVVRNIGWARTLADRWLELASDAIAVDGVADPLAQLRHLSADDLDNLKAVYRHLVAHFSATSPAATLDLHLALPTDYWSGHAHATAPEGLRFDIVNDEALPPLIALLPDAAEMIVDPSSAHHLHFVPLRLKAVRLETAPVEDRDITQDGG